MAEEEAAVEVAAEEVAVSLKDVRAQTTDLMVALIAILTRPGQEEEDRRNRVIVQSSEEVIDMALLFQAHLINQENTDVITTMELKNSDVVKTMECKIDMGGRGDLL